MARNPRPNPYIGPYPFEEGQDLYGRDQERRNLLDLLIAERVVVLYSPSGAGKTSLIQAALIPDLVEENFDVLPPVRVSAELPGELSGAAGTNRYVISALLSLEKELAKEQQSPVAELANVTLAQYLDRRPEPEDGLNSLVLIFDQFEEILTVDPTDRADKQEFFAQIGDALRNPQRWALFAMREEFLAGLDPYVRPIPTRLNTRFRLELLGERAAKEAIQKPAHKAGTVFADDAAQQLVDDLRRVRVQRPDGTTEESLGNTVEPVQLQVVCVRLWEGLEENDVEIDRSDLAAVGDVDTALQGYYAERVAAVAAENGVAERAIRDWFDEQLITEQGIRSQVVQEPEESGGLPNEVIWRLVDARLVRAERRRGVNWFELAHDRLIAPVQTDNLAWRAANLNDFQQQAASWDKRGRPAGVVLSGESLQQASTWTQSHADELTDAEKDLLQRSKDAHRSSRRIRLWAIAATAAGVIAVAFMVLALILLGQAKAENRKANSRRLAAQSEDLQDSQLDLALLLSLAANATADTPEARSSVLAALNQNPQIAAFLQPGIGPLTTLATSGDGKTLATGNKDGRVALWDIDGARPIQRATLAGQGSTIVDLAFNASSSQAELAVGDSKGLITLWDLDATPPISRTFQANAIRVNGLAYSPDGSRLATIGKNELKLWNLTGTAGAPTGTILDKGAPARSLAFAPDGNSVAVGREDGEVTLFDLSSGKPDILPGVPGLVSHLAWSADGQWLAAAHEKDKTNPPRVELWRLDSRTSSILATAVGEVTDLAFYPTGGDLAVSGADGRTEFWDTASSDRIRVLEGGHIGAIRGIGFGESCPGRPGVLSDVCLPRLATAGDDGKVVMWDPSGTPDSRLYRPIGSHTDEAWAVASSPDGTLLASAGKDKMVRLWDLQAGTSSALPGHTSEVRTVAWSPDGQRLASGGQDGLIILWQSGDPGKELARWSHPSRWPIGGLAFSPDGKSLVSGGFDNTVMLWDLSELPPAGRVLAQRTDKVWHVAFDKDGKTVWASDAAGTISRWNVRNGQQLGEPLQISTEAVSDLAISPDDQLLAAASYDHNVYLWDIASSTRLAALSQHQAPVSSVAFVDGGKALASTSHDGTVVFWDVATRRQIGEPVAVPSQLPVNGLALSSGGSTKESRGEPEWMASADDSGAVLLWRLDWPQMACEIAGRAFSDDEVTQYSLGSAGVKVCGQPR